ncbi:hypothetical protein [Sneathiella glossodoripedis]|uniref:hypothetical protein n=1 Tax=Sneathiella glossodoripedis TaxID=418853 RepID=UPI00047100C4|nr:hypothetical protein [Sneathiella glossodoripedis]
MTSVLDDTISQIVDLAEAQGIARSVTERATRLNYQNLALLSDNVQKDFLIKDLLSALKDLVEQDEANRPDGPLLDCDRAYRVIKQVEGKS